VTRAPHPVLKDYYETDAERQAFVTALFDGGARHYDRLCRLMSLGSGQRYRRQALQRAGLRPGMTVLDVATGTGLVARAAVGIVGEPRAVVGVDPSEGMLREARKAVAGPLVQGRIETLPFAAARFDLVTVGYALRHAADLEVAFGECRRVLRPGGRLCILEISRAPSAAARFVIRTYFQRVLPAVMGLTTASAEARLLSRYYWDTIATCVAPEVILEWLGRAGFVDTRRHATGGFLSEYLAVKPR
jgi:demethylmenaquinone methyltransferase/2-methoxy-6-polyprenyl-1,4-benzoquinol methylase